MSTQVLDKPVTTEINIITPIEEEYLWDGDHNKCYFCGEKAFDECYKCEKPICVEHVAEQQEHHCNWHSNHCPDCKGEKVSWKWNNEKGMR